MTNDLDLDDLRDKAEAATDGEWAWKEDSWDGPIVHRPDNGPGDVVVADTNQGLSDAQFIAAADPSTVLDLIERVEELEEAVGAYVDECFNEDGQKVGSALGTTEKRLLRLVREGDND